MRPRCWPSRVIDHVADLIGQHGDGLLVCQPGWCVVACRGRSANAAAELISKERDILDVWFESGVSYAAVLKPRHNGIRRICIWKGPDQHRGWFHSALLAGVITDHRAPYKAVLDAWFRARRAGRRCRSRRKRRGSAGRHQTIRGGNPASGYRPRIIAKIFGSPRRSSITRIEAYRKIRNTCRFLLSNLVRLRSGAASRALRTVALN